MNSKKIVLIAFILVAVAQLYVPAKMIMEREDVLATGTVHKFKTAPIDPNDPFRGKYITLSFLDNTITVSDSQHWVPGESVFVLLTTDKAGFAKIESVSKTIPTNTNNFLKAKIRYATGDKFNELTIDYPFDRYYMEESKAFDAEQVYRQVQRDSSQTAYALVSIKNGDAVLKDVLINETPIRELVEQNQLN